MASIFRLPDSTIQMIAAGEVITKPLNVVKELLENSLDAGSTNIRFIIEQGGVKLIEIIDNGHGIARVDADLLCRRYATSKLTTADDLTRISTFGFRGEALASISEMADLEVKTFNMKSDKQGWHAKYKAGVLVDKPIDKYLSNPGTHIKITNLFSSTHHRKEAIKTSFLDEKKSIIELITRYAIHHRDRVTISLKETNSPDLICLLAPIGIKPCIGMFFGVDMENNLIEFDAENDHLYESKAHIVFSKKKSTTSSGNNFIFILFVNNRLVECPELKREIEAQIYDNTNSKQDTTLVYLALTIPPCDVDVNTHPAKATVALHFQQEITAMIISTLRSRLKENLLNKEIGTGSGVQKTVGQLMLASQQSTVGSPSTPNNSQRLRLLAPGSLQASPNTSSPTRRPHDLIHTDSSQTTLKQHSKEERRIKRDLKLKSIHDLRILVAKEKTKDSAKTIKNSVFVGLFDHERALIQHETKLYAINLKAYLKEQYYQFYLFDFANFPPIEILPPGNKIRPMIETYLDDVRKHEFEQFNKLKFNDVDSVISELLKHSDMFEDYLSLKLTPDEILTLPCIMPDEVPNLAFLGKLLVDLANKIDILDEKLCLRTIGRLLADFYSEAPANLKDKEVHKRYHDLVESKLYVAIKNYLLIPEWLFQKENICQISDTKDLYKVFERC